MTFSKYRLHGQPISFEQSRRMNVQEHLNETLLQAQREAAAATRDVS